MAFLHILGLTEAILSALAGYFFAGDKWLYGSLSALIALAILLRTEKRVKKGDLDFVRAKDRISDAFLLSGITIGLGKYFALGLAALFAAVFLPHIATRARELRGGENRDFARKYRVFAVVLAGILQAAYANAMILGVLAVIGLAVVDFAGALRKPATKKKGGNVSSYWAKV